MRKIIAKRLLESKLTLPHSYMAIEIEMDSLMATRGKFNDQNKSKARPSPRSPILAALSPPPLHACCRTAPVALQSIGPCQACSLWMDTVAQRLITSPAPPDTGPSARTPYT